MITNHFKVLMAGLNALQVTQSKYPLLFLFLLLFLSCTDSKTSNPNKAGKKDRNEVGIYNISIAKKGCHGPCPNEIFEIDSSLKVKFYGGKFSELNRVARNGFYIGKATPEIWSDLCAIVHRLNPKKYYDDYTGNQDVEGLELMVSYENYSKRITGKIDALPPPILKTHDSIINILNTVKLQKTTDTFHFKTSHH